jgi:hypothetical protein
MYGAAGVTAGVGLSPVNIAVSIPAFWSTGRIYKLPRACKTLSLSEFRGGFVSLQISADAGWGVGFGAMFLGGDYPAAIAMSMVNPALLPTALIATASAFVGFRGNYVSLVPWNGTATAYCGVVF